MSDDRLLAQIANFDCCVLERDVELAETVLDPDYALVLVQPAPVVVPRAQWLDLLPDYVVHSYHVEEQFCDIVGDCAAVLQRVAMQATVLGADRSGLFVISDTWRRHGGEWRVWRRHSTPLAAGPMPT